MVCGSLRSWDEGWQVPTSSALCQARARLGAEPIRELYARVGRPLAGAGTPGAWLGDLRVMAIDGVQLDVPDTADNEDASVAVSPGLDAPYPKVEVLGLGESSPTPSSTRTSAESSSTSVNWPAHAGQHRSR